MERIVGISIYALILFLIYRLLSSSSLKCATILRFYTVCLCVMAFFYKPYITADLYRTYDIVAVFSRVDFWDFVKIYMIPSSTPIARLLYWIVGKIGIPNLLPVFATFITYSLLFYTVEKTQEIYSISRKGVAYTVFFLMTTSIYMSTIGGIRMMLSISLIVFAFFSESIKQEFRFSNFLLYVIAAFMHNMALPIIAIRALCLLLDERMRRWRGRVLTVLMLALFVFTFYFEELIKDIIESARYYINIDDYSDRWEYIMGAIFTLFFVVLLRNYSALPNKERFSKLKAYHVALKISIVIGVVFFFQFSIFYRFIGHLAPILAIPMIMIVLNESEQVSYKIWNRFSMETVTIACGLILLVISLSRGSMSSLKFFEL